MKKICSKHFICFFILSIFVSCASHNKPSDMVEGDLFFYFDRSKRVEIIDGLHNTLKEKYVGYEYKRDSINIDIDKTFKNAKKTEQNISKPKSKVLQAKANLDFFDRLHRLAATLKDGHLKVRREHNTPRIETGLIVKKVDGKYYIVAVREQLLELSNLYFKNARMPLLGDELVYVNDRPVQDVVDEIASYVSASSDEARQIGATDWLTSRKLLYPDVKNVKYTLKSSKEKAYEVELLWVQRQETFRWDVVNYFNSIDIKTVDAYLESFSKSQKEKVLKTKLTRRGYYELEPAVGLKNVKKYYWGKELEEEAVITGVYKYRGKAYSVIQIFAMLDDVYSKSGKHDFRKLYSDFLKQSQKLKRPLVIDNRFNGGGSGRLPMYMASFFVPKDSPQLSYPNAIYLDDMGKRLVMELKENHEFKITKDNPLDSFFNSMEDKILSGYKYTPLVPRGPSLPIPDKEVFYFNRPVVVLISPQCGSACDITSLLLKENPRVKLMGTQCHGMGLGFRSGNYYDNLSFKDKYGAIRVEIPNQLWAKPFKEFQIIDKYEAYKDRMVENKPVKADLIYKDTLDDYLNNSSGWYKNAASYLSNERKMH